MKTRNIWVFAALSIIFLILIAILFSIIFASGFNTAMPFGIGTIALIPVKGEITNYSDMFSTGLSAGEVADRIELACDDLSVSAILLDIDSPGGSVVPTKQIVYELRECEKPIVAYIGETGASGAYYIAAASDYIISDADSITGSIGVLSIVPNLEGFLEEWGIEVEVLKEGRNKAIGNLFEKMNSEQREILQGILNDTYIRFKDDVQKFRKDKVNAIVFETVADGRILSGQQAFKYGLVDELNTKDAAIEKAAELADLAPNPLIKEYPKKTSSMFDVFSQMGYSFGSGFRYAISEEAYPQFEIKAR